MKKLISVFLAMFVLTSCNGWFFQPSPYNPPTPFLPPTKTPSIVTPTPVVVGANSATPSVATAIPVITNTPFAFITNTPIVIPTDTPSITATVAVGAPAVSVVVLGCNTSIDVTHGMGEVTNAFITLRNSGNAQLTNIRATLFALDEGREHPDKTVEVTSIPVGQEATLKLTVDSTYREETPVQIEVTGDGGLFQRVGADSCREIGLFAPDPASLNTPVPVNP
ncbi:MAG: membrane lipoprotein lipid attachment site-containing protein [Chloroflexota bacterium]